MFMLIYVDLMNYLNILIVLIFFLMFKFKNSFLMILISMEFMLLVVINMCFSIEINNFNEWMFMYYMIFSVCEGVLGLCIMINMIFYMGNQNVMFVNMLW